MRQLKRPKMTKSNLTGRNLSVHAVYSVLISRDRSCSDIKLKAENIIYQFDRTMIAYE